MNTVRSWMYEHGRPNRVAALVNRGQVAILTAGLSPARWAALEVRGRRTGRAISFPVVVADYRGERYLVSMLGERANWVANVRAAGGRAVIRHGRRQPVALEEVSPEARAPILKRYLALAPGARAHFPVAHSAPVAAFEAIAADYPVFRICAAPPEPRVMSGPAKSMNEPR